MLNVKYNCFTSQVNRMNIKRVRLTDNGWLDNDLNCDGDGGCGLLIGVSVGLLMRIGCKVCGDGDGEARNWLNCKRYVTKHTMINNKPNNIIAYLWFGQVDNRKCIRFTSFFVRGTL